ncbi:hypothetical protein NDU88_003321 [Pleurodeles waltl]|uniref:Uncharacterized protein n=1 Tax=Pleurodeles waltl TaxID=8319 RepID=A0AAV7SDC1_PLEWA|nr:hypothetical protein NDU88_003321 [Pleurodeles waltl]
MELLVELHSRAAITVIGVATQPTLPSLLHPEHFETRQIKELSPELGISNPGSARALVRDPVTASYPSQAGKIFPGLQVLVLGTLRNGRLANETQGQGLQTQGLLGLSSRVRESFISKETREDFPGDVGPCTGHFEKRWADEQSPDRGLLSQGANTNAS